MHLLAMSVQRCRRVLALTGVGVALVACAVRVATPPVISCEKWAAESARAIESAAESERYVRALEAIGKACDAVPSALRGGARTAAKRATRRERNDLLDAATRRLLPQECHPWSPSSPALDIIGRCPLDPDLGIARRALGDMAGAEYAFLKALQKSMRDAKIYTAATERVLHDFALAAALEGASGGRKSRESGS